MNTESNASGAGRLIEIDGTYNARDVGGITTASGARVRTGRLLRSAALDSLTDTGIEQIRAFELRTVLDLRGEAEVDDDGRFPVDRVPVRWEHLATVGGPPKDRTTNAATQVFEHPDPMALIYRRLIEGNGAAFARGLRILSDRANLPAAVHCASGKDRTGLFVVLLHLVLGVTLDDALAHYQQDAATTERSRLDMAARQPQMAEMMPPEKLTRMAGTNSRWVLGALSSIGGEHAVPEWLSAQGCDAHTQANLRAAFLD